MSGFIGGPRTEILSLNIKGRVTYRSPRVVYKQTEKVVYTLIGIFIYPPKDTTETA